MSLVKGTSEYWKQFLFDLLVVPKQLRIATSFLTFSRADL